MIEPGWLNKLEYYLLPYILCIQKHINTKIRETQQQMTQLLEKIVLMVADFFMLLMEEIIYANNIWNLV